MSDEDLQLLITLDYPWYGPDEDTFHHLQPEILSRTGPVSRFQQEATRPLSEEVLNSA